MANEDTGARTGEAESVRQRASRAPAWFVTATISAIAGLLAGLVPALIAAGAAHSEAGDERRTIAYSDYLSDQTKFNEFVWGQLPWAGSDAPGPVPTDQTDFWATASNLQATLESDYLTASMSTRDDLLLADLDHMHSSQQTMWLKFKCMSGASSAADCPAGAQYDLAPHAQVKAELDAWLTDMEETKKSFTGRARGLLG